MRKKIKKALQIIYFNLRWTKQLFQKHYSFIKVCRLLFIQDIKKDDVLTGILLIVFLRTNTFCIGFNLWLHVIIMSRTSFRVNPHSTVCLNVKELLARSRPHIWSWSDLIHKRTLNHFAKLAKWLSIRLRTKWLWVRIPLFKIRFL